MWNSHSLSTECNWSPLKLFTAFSLGSALFTNEVSVDPQTYGIDYEETSDDEDLQPVNVPTTHNPVSLAEFLRLQTAINPLATSDSYGTDLYLQAIFLVNGLINAD